MAEPTKADLVAENEALKAQLAEAAEAPVAEDDKRNIFQRILDIAREVGVLEPERSGGVPFAFRGVDAVVSKLSPLLNKHGVFIAPVRAGQELEQREAGGNKIVTKANVVVEYRAFAADGTYVDFQVLGQADDFADRSTAQAMSVAFRILLLQMFHIAAFGNEEQASEDTKNTREAAGQAKVDAARGAGAPAPAAPAKSDPADQMRKAILGAASAKGWNGEQINAFADETTGVSRDQWWDNPDLLNKILLKING